MLNHLQQTHKPSQQKLVFSLIRCLCFYQSLMIVFWNNDDLKILDIYHNRNYHYRTLFSKQPVSCTQYPKIFYKNPPNRLQDSTMHPTIKNDYILVVIPSKVSKPLPRCWTIVNNQPYQVTKKNYFLYYSTFVFPIVLIFALVINYDLTTDCYSPLNQVCSAELWPENYSLYPIMPEQ